MNQKLQRGPSTLPWGTLELFDLLIDTTSDAHALHSIKTRKRLQMGVLRRPHFVKISYKCNLKLS